MTIGMTMLMFIGITLWGWCWLYRLSVVAFLAPHGSLAGSHHDYALVRLCGWLVSRVVGAEMTDTLNFDYDETTALLVRARSFLERGWCRHALARDSAGIATDPISSRAVAWCPYGALTAARMPYHLVHRQASPDCCHGRLRRRGFQRRPEDGRAGSGGVRPCYRDGRPAMTIPKAPSWPIVIISGSAGGVANWYFDASLPGLLVLMALSALLMLLFPRKTRLP